MEQLPAGATAKISQIRMSQNARSAHGLLEFGWDGNMTAADDIVPI
jgi:hypothetical protein